MPWEAWAVALFVGCASSSIYNIYESHCYSVLSLSFCVVVTPSAARWDQCFQGPLTVMFASSAFTVATVNLNLLWLQVHFLQKLEAIKGGVAISLSWSCNDIRGIRTDMKLCGCKFSSVASVLSLDGQMLRTSYQEKPNKWIPVY